MQTHKKKVDALVRQLRADGSGTVRLGKDTSNLFRDRTPQQARRIDVRAFNQVLDVDSAAGIVDVEGMTSYGALAAAMMAKGMLPGAVPQLKAITIGGAVSGLGIEASSFKFGLVHDTVEELEVLLPDGDVVVCTPTNEYSDLFFGFPNSYGTLGYALRVKAKAFPAKKYVALTHVRHRDPRAFFQDLATWCGRPVDFVDGVVFAPDEMYLVIGELVGEAPYASDYTFMNIYYRSIREREKDYLTTLDYIWRWDTDWFWCSSVFLVQNPTVRRLVGRRRLNSDTYMKLLRLNRRWRLTDTLDRLTGIHAEQVIQDVDLPVERAPEFLEFLQREIRIKPIWICPFRAYDPARTYGLWPIDPKTLYVNFGFWSEVRGRVAHPRGHFNRLIERKLTELGGIKSLYSDSFYEADEFWAIFDKPAYDRLKAKYDPKGRLGDLYRKCVLRE
jgi:FAD/FMN-containing dehydrogenase